MCVYESKHKTHEDIVIDMSDNELNARDQHAGLSGGACVPHAKSPAEKNASFFRANKPLLFLRS